GAAVAAVDTNVRRVLTRVVDGETTTRTPAAVQELADAMLVVERPGDWNQTLMEHGALVCTAAAPRCADCPVRTWCAAAPGIQQVRERHGTYRAPRRTPGQGPYAGSTRFYRGRIVDLLRTEHAAGGLSPDEVGRRLRLDFSDDDLPWLQGVLAGLAADGLVEWPDTGGPVRLAGQGEQIPPGRPR